VGNETDRPRGAFVPDGALLLALARAARGAAVATAAFFVRCIAALTELACAD